MLNILSNDSPRSTEPSASALSSITGHTTSPTAAKNLLPKAKEFESILLAQWLQETESSFASVPDSSDEQDAGDDQLKGFAVQQLAKAFTNAGGIGIADKVVVALAKSQGEVTGVSPHHGHHGHVTEAP